MSTVGVRLFGVDNSREVAATRRHPHDCSKEVPPPRRPGAGRTRNSPSESSICAAPRVEMQRRLHDRMRGTLHKATPRERSCPLPVGSSGRTTESTTLTDSARATALRVLVPLSSAVWMHARPAVVASETKSRRASIDAGASSLDACLPGYIRVAFMGQRVGRYRASVVSSIKRPVETRLSHVAAERIPLGSARTVSAESAGHTVPSSKASGSATSMA